MKHKLIHLFTLMLMMSISFSTFAQSGEEYFNLGLQAHKSGNYDQAIIYYKKAISAGYINSGVIYGTLGYAYYDKGDYDQAIIYYNKAISAGCTFVGDTYANLGTAYLKKGDYDQAIIHLNKAISAGDIDGGTYANLGTAYFFKGDFDQAIIYTNKAISAGYINDGVTYLLLGTAYLKKDDYDQAIIYYNKEISAGNINGGANYALLGTAYYNKGDYDQAIIHLNKAISAGYINDGMTYFFLGSAYGYKGDYDQEIICLNKAISAGCINDGVTYNNLGYAYLGKGDYDQAITYLNKAISAGYIDGGVTYNNLGNAYLKKGDYDQAIIYLNKAISAGGTGNGTVYNNLGRAYFKKKDYDQSIDYFQKSIDTGCTFAYRGLAYLYALRSDGKSDMGKAMSCIEKGVNATPKDVSILSCKAELLLLQGNRDGALELWREIVANNPDYGLIDSQTEFKLATAMRDNDFTAYEEATRSGVDIISTASASSNVNSFAVIISNENYKHESKVQFAGTDGEIFGQYCTHYLGIPQKQIHVVKDATLNDIMHELDWLKKISDAYHGDERIIFYYAGHGIPDESTKESYLLPVDGYGTNPKSGYSLEELYKQLGALPSKSCVVFLDACFSGANRGEGMMANSRGVSIKVVSSRPQGNLVVFSAAQGDETAYPYKEEKHGMFTYYLLKKLQETCGDVTLGELGQYITDNVKKKSIVENGKSQTPNIIPASGATNWQSWKLK